MKKYGQYTKKSVKNYCVIDIETTGLSCTDDHIIEIGLLKVRNNQIVEQYSQLINPQCQLSPFICELTGITNDMLDSMPLLDMITHEIFAFIGQDTLLGHNTAFDLRFVAEQCHRDIENDYVDTLHLSRQAFPQLKRHRLTDLVNHLQLSQNAHRAIADCIATHELYEIIKKRHP